MATLKLASAGDDIKLWDCNGFTFSKQFNTHSHNVASVSWSRDNLSIASASSAGDKISLAYTETTGYFKEIAVDEGCTCVALNSTARFVLGGCIGGLVHIWDVKLNQLKQTYRGHTGPVLTVAFNGDDTVIASGSKTGDIRLYSVVTGVASSPMVRPSAQAVEQLQYSFFRKSLLASAADCGTVCLWDTNKRALVHAFSSTHKAPATAVAFSPSNDMLLTSAGLDKRILCYDVNGKVAVQTMTAESPLTSIAMLHDGTTLVVGSTRGKIYVYDLRKNSSPVRVIVAHKASVRCLQFQYNVKATSKGSDVGVKGRASMSVSSGSRSSRLSSETRRSPANSLSSSTADSHANYRPAGSSSPSDEKMARPGLVPGRLAAGDLDMHSPLRETAALLADSRRPASPGLEPPRTQPAGQPSSAADARTPAKSDATYMDGMFSPLCGDPDDPHAPLGGSVSPLIRSNSFGHLDSSADTSITARRIGRSASHHQMPPPSPAAQPARHSASVSNGLDNFATLTTAVAVKPTCWGQPVGPVEGRGAAPPVANGPAAAYAGPSGSLVSPDSAVCSPDRAGSVLGVGALGVGAAGGEGPPVAPTIQAEFIKTIVEDLLQDTKDELRRDILNLQMTMLKQFQTQQMELGALLQQHCISEVLQENERLREENRRLKKKF